MKRLYFLIIIAGFLFPYKLLAQCFVNISTNPKNTTQLDCTHGSLTLTANATGRGRITYLWNTKKTISSIRVSDSDKYIVTINDALGCKASSSITIKKNITKPTVTAQALPDTICYGNTSILRASGAKNYLWKPGSYKSTPYAVSPKLTTLYTVTGTASNGCIGTNNIKVVVRPQLKASMTGPRFVCRNPSQPVVKFTGSGGTRPYTFHYNIDSGSAVSITTIGMDTAVAVSAPLTSADTLHYHLTSVSDGSGCTLALNKTKNLTIIILPATVTAQASRDTICRGDITTLAAFGADSLQWLPDSIKGATINVRPDSTQTYTVAGIASNGCAATDSIKVVVRTLPTAIISAITSVCQNDSQFPVRFTGSGGTRPYTFTYNVNSGTANLITTVGTNTTVADSSSTAKVGTFIYHLMLVNDSSGCRQIQTDSVNITVNPIPSKPDFTSLSRYPDSVTLQLCGGSENINFNINSPSSGISYKWTSTANPSMLVIRDTIHANTVVSFAYPGKDTINAIAINATGGCTDTVSQVVQVDNANSGIDKRKIFLKQPGNLLIYPDNSLTGYQWGYDTIMRTSPGSAFGLPVPVQDQVYQFFIPSPKFIDSANNLLDTTHYLYWVMLQNAGCYTRVYYNGPYANRAIPVASPDNIVQLQVIPNPNNGKFRISLKGNIYGKMDAKIYNPMGQVVFGKSFMKIVPNVTEIFNTGNLPGGFYSLILQSSDLKQVVSHFVIQR